MRASLLLILVVSSVLVADTEGWKWGQKVWNKIKDVAKKAVDIYKKVKPFIPSIPGIGKRSVPELPENVQTMLGADCLGLIQSGDIAEIMDNAQEFEADVLADCQDDDNPQECVDTVMEFIDNCVQYAQSQNAGVRK